MPRQRRNQEPEPTNVQPSEDRISSFREYIRAIRERVYESPVSYQSIAQVIDDWASQRSPGSFWHALLNDPPRVGPYRITGLESESHMNGDMTVRFSLNDTNGDSAPPEVLAAVSDALNRALRQAISSTWIGRSPLAPPEIEISPSHMTTQPPPARPRESDSFGRWGRSRNVGEWFHDDWSSVSSGSQYRMTYTTASSGTVSYTPPKAKPSPKPATPRYERVYLDTSIGAEEFLERFGELTSAIELNSDEQIVVQSLPNRVGGYYHAVVKVVKL